MPSTRLALHRTWLLALAVAVSAACGTEDSDTTGESCEGLTECTGAAGGTTPGGGASGQAAAGAVDASAATGSGTGGVGATGGHSGVGAPGGHSGSAPGGRSGVGATGGHSGSAPGGSSGALPTGGLGATGAVPPATGGVGNSGGAAGSGATGALATGGSSGLGGGSASGSGGEPPLAGTGGAAGEPPIAGAGGTTAEVCPGGEVDGAQAQQLVADGAVLLDVRSASEYAADHLPGAINIPLDELGQRMGELSAAMPIVTYCHSGARAASAAEQLLAAGFVVCVLGPMDAWYD